MNLKELIKEVERLNDINYYKRNCNITFLEGIKQTVEAVDGNLYFLKIEGKDYMNKRKDWQKLKKLLGVK